MSDAGQGQQGRPLEEAKALISRADAFVETGDDEAALAMYVEVAARFADVKDLAVRQQAALASLRRGGRLAKLERSGEAIAVYDELADAYLKSPDTRTREIVAQALLNRANAFEALDRMDDALAGWEFVAREFVSSDDEKTREHVAWALFNKAFELADRDDVDGAIAGYDDLIGRFRTATDPVIRKRVTWALWNSTSLLEKVARADECGARYEELVSRRDDKLDEEFGDIVRWSVHQCLSATTDENRVEGYIAVLDDLIVEFGDATDLRNRSVVAGAYVMKASALGQLGRPDDEFLTYEALVNSFAAAPEAELRVTAAEGLSRMAYVLDVRGEREGALNAYDRAIALVTENSEARAGGLLVNYLYERGRLLRRLDRDAEAVVVFSSAADAYGRLAANGAAPTEAAVSGILSVLSKAVALVRLGSDDALEATRSELATVIGGTAVRNADRCAPVETPPDERMAELLAQIHASDCWLLFATADNSSDLRRSMAARAVDLYRQTEPWLRNVDEWEAPAPMAALGVRNIADGFALLSRWWSDRNRRTLPLPTRPLLEWTMQMAGLDDWAADQGHPLDLQESPDVVEATLDAQRDALAAHSDADDEPARQKLAAAFVAATHLYDLFEVLRSSDVGRQVLSNDQLNSFACWQLMDARQWAAWARERLPDAVLAGAAMMLIAESFFTAAHGEASPVFPDRFLLRELVDDGDLSDWVAEQGYRLPAWLGGTEGAAGG